MGHIVVPEFVSKEFISQINGTLDDADARPEDKQFTAEGKNANTSVVDSRRIPEIVGEIFNMVYKVNEEVFGYDLFARWPETVNVNDYLTDQEYPWHRDAVTNNAPHDIKLTMLLNLSEHEFEGGEFELFTGKPEHVKELDNPGTLCVFVSPTYHRVRPVTKGKRRSISAWFKGPNWR